MANYNKLYKKLHEEFELELNEDFWQHKQSGKWIITHNAVKKIAAQQRKKGFIIETPKVDDWKILSDQAGSHGREIVLAGDFYLKDSKGNVLNHASPIGEANEKNCRLAFMWTMAEKRMYDRGVLSLLQIAELGGYSDIEADDFSKSKNPPTKPPSEPKKQPEPTKVEQAAPQVPVKRPPAPPSRPTPKIGPPSIAPPNVAPPVREEVKPLASAPENFDEGAAKALQLVVSILKEKNTEGMGLTVGQLSMAVHDMGENLDVKEVLKEGLEKNLIEKTGERRATRYHAAASEKPPMTRNEYNVLWQNTSEILRQKEVSYPQITAIVNKVTGYDTAISAFNSGILTAEHIAEIERLGILSTAT